MYYLSIKPKSCATHKIKELLICESTFIEIRSITNERKNYTMFFFIDKISSFTLKSLLTITDLENRLQHNCLA